MSTGPFVNPNPASPVVPPPPNSPPPPPTQTPTTPPSPPASTPTALRTRIAVVREWATPILLLVLIVTLITVKFWPSPAPASVDGVTLGRQYAPILVNTYSQAWDAAADNLAQGKAVSEAQKVLQDTWKSLRIKAFDQKVTPVLSQALPEGTEPRDSAHRAQVAQLWHDFAKGLRKGR